MTTYRISEFFSRKAAGKHVDKLGNCAVAEGTETELFGVMVRYRITDEAIEWCYI